MTSDDSGISVIATRIERSGAQVRTIWVMATTHSTTTSGFTFAYHSGLYVSPAMRIT